MKMNFLIVLLFLLLTTSITIAQTPTSNRSMLTITGYVEDAALERPVEYATVVIYSEADSVQANGTITDSEGVFVVTGLKPGSYYLKASFLGYEDLYMSDLRVGRKNPMKDVGTIKLNQSSIQLEGAEFVIERAPIEYRIDKKVINVSKQATSASGSAVDVMQNIPSVNVDIDGNVSLRGSTNFSVLVDGRPSMLDAADLLEQIPASSIENIEIITNPSAKYEPDGTSGIVNIILKKNALKGVSGMVTTNYGDADRYGGDVQLGLRGNKLNATLGLNYNKRSRPGDSEVLNYTAIDGETYYYTSDGTSFRSRDRGGITASLDYNLTENDVIGFGGRYNLFQMEHENDLIYEEWSTINPEYILSNSWGESNRKFGFFALYTDYQHEFKKEDHKILARAYVGGRDGDEESITELSDLNGTITEAKKSTETGPGRRIDLKVEYTNPLTEKTKLESGYQGRIGHSTDESKSWGWDTNTDSYVFEPQFSNDVDYRRSIHSVYGIFSSEVGKLGYQVGLRGEYTFRKIKLEDTGDIYEIDRADLFPSSHLSYKLNDDQQLMASYSRRIDRPRRWYLEPFETWMDAYNVRRGNPGLEPEFIDSWEAGYQRTIGDYQVSIEGYYRVTNNLVERVRSVYAEDVTLMTVENVGEQRNLGTELMLEGNLQKWWNVNLMGNFYKNNIEGTLYNVDYSDDNYNWGIRFNNTFMLSKTFRIMLNNRYNSPMIFSQGEMEEMYQTDMALQKTFANRKYTVIMQVQDIFSTGKHVMTTEGPNFYTYSKYDFDSPRFMLTLKMNINNFKQKRSDDQSSSSMINDEM